MSNGKRLAAERALEHVQPGSVIGIGTGSTVAFFIDALARGPVTIDAAVSSSEQTTWQLRSVGIRVLELPEVERLPLYVDGADACDPQRCLVKGGGGALTREKILAEASDTFVCIVDASKRVARLGAFALPIEVIPMAHRLVARRLEELTGGNPRLREGFVTDNGNLVIDLHGLDIAEPEKLESELEHIPGVVTVGLFARRRADIVIVGDAAAAT